MKHRQEKKKTKKRTNRASVNCKTTSDTLTNL